MPRQVAFATRYPSSKPETCALGLVDSFHYCVYTHEQVSFSRIHIQRGQSFTICGEEDKSERGI